VGAQGTVTLTVGASPIDRYVQTVTGQAAIIAGSHVEAFFMSGDSTADNDVDAHEMAASLAKLTCKVNTPGDSFDITLQCVDGMLLQGDIKARWVWN
jgi:hypothetical protein